MLFSKKEVLEDRIIRLLLGNNQTVKSLRKHLEKEDICVSIQAIYKALRMLTNEEITIKHSTDYSLNEEWRRNISERFDTKKEPLALSEGESIRFDLNSLVSLDQKWKNIVLPLQDKFKGIPVFSYNPHEIWIHLSKSREKSELEYYKSFEKNRTMFYALSGGKTKHDLEIAKLLKNSYVKTSTGYMPFPNTEYPLIINDYIITTKITLKMSTKIENIYNMSISVSELKHELQTIGIEKVRLKVIIERNKEKAKKLRKRIAKDFHVPKELREKFDLF